MNPTPNTVHVDRPLTILSVAYMQSQEHFVASQIFPVVPVAKQSDLYYKWDKEDWFRDEAELRAPGTESAGGNYSVGTDNYACKVHSFHKDVDDQTRANSDEAINPDRSATNFVTQRLLLRREKQWLSRYFKAGVWGTDKTGGAAGGGADFVQWSDYVNSNPRTDIKLGRRTILATTGFSPNTLVLSYDAADALIDHPDFVDRVKYTSKESVTPEMIAKYFDIERVFVLKAVENTAKKGQPSAMGFAHGKHALLCYVAPEPALDTPSAGYTFTWTYAPISQLKGQQNGLAIKRFRMEHLESDRIEGNMAFDDKVVGSDLGYFFANCVS